MGKELEGTKKMLKEEMRNKPTSKEGGGYNGRRKSDEQSMYGDTKAMHGHMAFHDKHHEKFHKAVEHEEGRCDDIDECGHVPNRNRTKMEY